tara:strand:- start:7689 stop:8486 length:798 start_codon:yes stop_codon:yes gene_type:complete
MRLYDKIQCVLNDLHTSCSVHTPIMLNNSIGNCLLPECISKEDGVTYTDMSVHVDSMPHLDPYELLMREHNILSICYAENVKDGDNPTDVGISLNVIPSQFWGKKNPQAAMEGANCLLREIHLVGDYEDLRIEDANLDPVCVSDVHLKSVLDFYGAVSNYNKLFNAIARRIIEKTTGSYSYLLPIFGSFDRAVARKIVGRAVANKLAKVTDKDGANYKNSFVQMLCSDDQFVPNEFNNTLDAFQNMIDLRGLNENVENIIKKAYA